MRDINERLAAEIETLRWTSGSAAQAADRSYAFSLETPLYGGGVRPGEVDVEQPIRVSGVRGQLRYWWRIAHGPFESSTAMFKREAAIWGGIGKQQATASRVRVRVSDVGEVRTAVAFEYKRNGEVYRTTPDAAEWVADYALFPARGTLTKEKRTIETAPHTLILPPLGFRLHLALDPELSEAQRAEVDTALRWWASFGGVGARTRRGLGAVRSSELTPVSAEEIEARGGRLVLRSALPGDALAAWHQAIGKLKAFRQGKDLGRNRGSGQTPGRSRWPEPDQIRRHAGTHAPAHPPEHPVKTLMPRAAFGMPIIFHFKDRGEPEDHSLQPVDRDRMASPLILRPYWSNGRWQPCALLLPGWEQALRTTTTFGSGSTFAVWPASEQAAKAAAAGIAPIKDRGDDPLSAFLTWFAEG